jgi:hypothetical protein
MKKLGSTRTASALFALVALALILAQPISAAAQKRRPNPPPPPPPSAEPRTDSQTSTVPNMRTMDQAALEMAILMSKRWTPADQERERRRVTAQITMELERLSQIEAETIAQASIKSIDDYKNLARATSEIKERALKIKYNLPFVLKDKGEKIRREADASQLGTMLPELSRVIKSFIANPALRVNSPNDVELRAAAGHDMEGIIKLSETINKIAKALSKPLVARK